MRGALDNIDFFTGGRFRILKRPSQVGKRPRKIFQKIFFTLVCIDTVKNRMAIIKFPFLNMKPHPNGKAAK